MKERFYTAVAERQVTTQLASGLRVVIVPRPTYHETYAMLSVDYGSIDTTYVPLGASDKVQDPEGIAHFLEHKLFEKADHDAFDLFGATGASANAFTGATRTSFLFSATDQIDENLKTLLDFVQDPYFSEATVNKEKGIIGQEIMMYQDDPGWRLYFGILGNLYPTHPVRNDVTGSVESIAAITPDLLYRAYRTFYQPGNMTLTVVGNVDPQHVIELAEADQAGRTIAPYQAPVRPVSFDGDLAAILPYRAATLPLVRPKSIVGIKGTTPVDDDLVGTKYAITVRLLLEMLFGDSSPLYQSWYDAGIVDDSFDFDFTAQRTYNYATLGGDATDASALSEALTAVIAKGADQPLLEEARFARIKHAALGKYYQSLNSLEQVANQVSDQSFGPIGLFDLADVMQAITLADLQAAAGQFFRLDAVSVFHILPEVDA
ncbi:EF-P 5-aminopentanol modification-associated protein YfmH [Lacticaseibacillus mingshuiensis]|uniref:EF-P 5-aminopentanol modification-associated protein YfmH n=1 Tax=Lacticaseibacillus mingshuiensis TaxID=2799574 RepID=A0ABW4CG77_9LACO|nr:pitrilysin family protein [Lacticaseibacillus mingshuiensis]